MNIANTPEPPYFAVIFSSHRHADDAEYADTAKHMLELASQSEGFLGVESVRDSGGFGITVSYWKSEEAIAAWREEEEHRLARKRGREEWYADFQVRVACVERTYGKSGK